MTTGKPARNAYRSQSGQTASNARPASDTTTKRGGWRRFGGLAYLEPGSPRFGLLLLLLISAYLLSAFTSSAGTSAILIVLYLVVISLAVLNARIGRRTARLIIAIAFGGSVVTVALVLSPVVDARGVAGLWAALMLLFGVILILTRVFAQREVTLQSIFGAVSAYMIIGLMFAAIYLAMSKFGSGNFFADGEKSDIKTFQYFSFTTLTTLGYGDYTAAGSGGQAVAVLEALLGQVFLATLVARLVAAFRGPRPSAAGPARPGRAGRPGRAVGTPAGRGPRQSYRRPHKPEGRTQPVPLGHVAQPAMGSRP
jgi:Ion channel